MRLATFLLSFLCFLAAASENQGYYHFPEIKDDVIIFTAEGDLWKVGKTGGQATRLTTNFGLESNARISPDGKTIAFTANYEGPGDVYTMPIDGGSPKRVTYSETVALVRGWTEDGKIIFATSDDSSFWVDLRLMVIDPDSRKQIHVPLNQASDGVFNQQGELFFTRLTGPHDSIRNYRGGSARQLWLQKPGKEATPLTNNHPGTSQSPSIWAERVYFASDRDSTMNLWSMDFQGRDLKQHTFYKNEDISYPSVDKGSAVYQIGADLHLLDIASGKTEKLNITLSSDMEQRRARWVERPMEYLSSADLSPDNSSLALTARGSIVIHPMKSGRTITLPKPEPDLFFQSAQFIPTTGNILAVASQQTNQSFWLLPSNGQPEAEEIFVSETTLAYPPVISPDGALFAWTDTNDVLWITEIESNETRKVFESEQGNFGPDDISWSPDSLWLSFTTAASNQNRQIYVYSLKSNTAQPVTSDRTSSHSTAWSSDGQWLYFISQRFYQSKIHNPFALNQPEPYSEQNDGLFMLAMDPEAHWPFEPDNELSGISNSQESQPNEPEESSLNIHLDGVQKRLYQVPVPPGQYSQLSVAGDYLIWMEERDDQTANLISMPIANSDNDPFTMASGINNYLVSFDQENLLLLVNDELYPFPVGASEEAYNANPVELHNWRVRVHPQEEWRQIVYDVWRLQKDLFVDKDMNSTDWSGVLDHFLPLADRITTRDELDLLLGMMLGRLGVLHTYLTPGDARDNNNWAFQGSLGGRFTKVPEGFRIDSIYQASPERPSETSPLARPDVNLQPGDTITSINNQSVAEAETPEELLVFESNTQVLLNVKKASGEPLQKIIRPISPNELSQLRYHDWVEERRNRVDSQGDKKIGYIHLSALGSDNFTEWVQQYYPVHNRDGLILDLRYNMGGNISNWILNRLIRKAFSYETARGKESAWSMEYAFRGHIVLLINEYTSSDGEAFTDGFRRFNLGTIIGTRTWGGRIFMNLEPLLDNGAVSVPRFAHYFDNRKWPAENWGVEPDITVDNLPYATYQGEDAQLNRAIKLLLEKIEQEPVQRPHAPDTPIAAPHLQTQ